MRWMWIVALLIALTPLKGFAGTIQAASCSQSHVQEAINSASDGDTVAVPAGSCTWTSSVVVPETKGLTIQGAGVGVTTISGNARLLTLLTTPGKSYRVSQFTWNGSSASILIRSRAPIGTDSFRIHHNRFTGGGKIWVTCRCYGVIDHNTFSGSTPFNTIWVEEYAYYNRGDGFYSDGGAASWIRPAPLGTAEAVFVEDNTFDFANPGAGFSCADSKIGGRVVIRYNTIKNINCGGHDAELTNERGGRSVEFYKNNVQYTSGDPKMAIFHRGGTGVMWSNRFRTVSFDWANTPFIVRNTRSDGGEPGRDPWIPTCNGSAGKFCLGGPPKSCNTNADCTGAFIGPCVPIDGPAANGYPCRDQLGCGLTNPVTGEQALEPFYFWDNYHCYGPGGNCNPDPPNGIPSTTIWIHEGKQHLVDGRDFYSNTKKPGYKPFTYPHPLVTETTGQPPSPPTNLRVTQLTGQ